MRSFLSRLIFPDFCAGCQSRGQLLCRNCLNNLCLVDQQLPAEYYPHHTPHIERVWSAVEYIDVAEIIVQRVKYQRYWSYAPLMGQLMALCCGPQLREAEIDFLIPVPLAPKRQRWRGFNQSLLLAQELSRALNLPIAKESLRRQQSQQQQAKLNWKQRKSVYHDFVARPHEIQEKTVCLIDDVVTTGATLDVCAEKLLEVGVKKVFATTFATA